MLQRQKYNQDKLPQQRIDLLNEIKFIWDEYEERWNNSYYELRNIYLKEGNIDLIIGPLAYNYSKIKNLKKKFKFLNIIINKFDISIYLQRCKFAISNSSSVIYEFNYLDIPVCLFSTSENQKNNI